MRLPPLWLCRPPPPPLCRLLSRLRIQSSTFGRSLSFLFIISDRSIYIYHLLKSKTKTYITMPLSDETKDRYNAVLGYVLGILGGENTHVQDFADKLNRRIAKVRLFWTASLTTFTSFWFSPICYTNKYLVIDCFQRWVDPLDHLHRLQELLPPAIPHQVCISYAIVPNHTQVTNLHIPLQAHYSLSIIVR